MLCGAALAAPILPAAGNIAPYSAGDGSWSSNPFILYPAETPEQAMWSPAPLEADAPFYQADWNVTLRGSYIRDNTGARYEGLVLPSGTLTHVGKLLSFHITADGQFSKTDGEKVNVDQLRISGGSVVTFSPEANLATNGSLSMQQEDSHATDVATDVETTPVEISGATDTTYTARFGRFNVALRANAGRDTFGPSTLADGSQQDNTSQNNTSVGGGARLGVNVTPVLELFTDTAASRTMFDAPSTALGTLLDGNLYTIKAGASAHWGDVLTASASIGAGLERFDDPTLADVRATLYDASLTFKPTETLTLDGVLSTTISPPGPDGSGSARIEYAATSGANYKVNDWLMWRASAGWHSARYADSGVTDRGYDFGIGADYLLSPHTTLSADYSFSHSAISPSPPVDSQTVSVGVTFKK